MRLLSGFDAESKILERRLETPLGWPGEAVRHSSCENRPMNR